MFQPKPIIVKQYVHPLTAVGLRLAYVLGILFVGLILGFIVGTTPIHLKFEGLVSTETGTLPDYTPSEMVAGAVKTLPLDNHAFVWNPEDYRKEIECLAKNIYFEASQEEIKGQIAVGLVTINRVLDRRFPNTVCDVVWQKRRNKKTGKYIAQFSWTWDGKPDNPKVKHIWEETVRLAEAMLAEHTLGNFVDFTEGATHYHALYVEPYWKHKLENVATIGLHTFYRTSFTQKKCPGCRKVAVEQQL